MEKLVQLSHKVVVRGGTWVEYNTELARTEKILGSYRVGLGGKQEEIKIYRLHEDGLVDKLIYDPQTKKMIVSNLVSRNGGLIARDEKTHQIVLKFTETRG